MPLDPSIVPIVELMNAASAEAPPLAEQTPEMRREAYVGIANIVPPGPELASVVDDQVAGPAGPIPIRIYSPNDDGGVGVIVFYHGGGWCIGDIETHDEVCRQLANQSGAAVVSPHYRLGPEARFPAAVDDCYAVLEWVGDNKDRLGGANAKIAVSGDSAGGNLAAVMALMSRDKNGPIIASQLLVYPATDFRMGHQSLIDNGEGYLLTKESMDWFSANYLSSPDDALDWRASPLLAETLTGLPPALVITAEFDPLRDEGTAYAAAMQAAGVDVTHTNYEGMVHVFFQLGPLVPKGAQAVSEVAAMAKATLAS